MARPQVSRALVTGGSSGIGLAVAKQLAARGIEVWLAARRRDRLEAAVEAIAKSGGRAHAFELDVAKVDETVERLARLDAETGGIDLVVANAGLAGARGGIPLPDCEWADVRDILHTNLTGAAATLFPFIRPMIARGHGHLVGISSINADLPTGRSAAYGGSKAGFTSFLEGADIELRALGVDVTIIHPGFVATPALDEMRGEVAMPIVVSAERAARIIDRAIVRRARLVRFPWIMGVVARLVAWLPRFITRPLIRRSSLPASKKLPA
jgi:short-subunit dehydrogenase